MPCAHWVHLEQPELFNHIVREWLNSVFEQNLVTRDEL